MRFLSHRHRADDGISLRTSANRERGVSARGVRAQTICGKPIATARIVRRLFYNEDVGGMSCTCALAQQRQAIELSRIHPSLAASGRVLASGAAQGHWRYGPQSHAATVGARLRADSDEVVVSAEVA